MEALPNYEKYKKTKLPWIPEIPDSWHVRKLAHAINYSVGFTPESGNPLYYGNEFSWANISDLGPKILHKTSKGITQEAVAKYQKKPVPAGNLLYSFKLSVGQVSFAGTEMFTNEAIASFAESEWIHLPYFYYLAPIAIIQNASENIYGAKILNQEAINNAKLIIPPPEEQQSIARFLDHKTAQIDALIAKKRVLLDKLAEKRTALISHAVTKGLNPGAPMKDSGVAWLGEIPAHWEVKKLKYSTNISTGFAFSSDDYEPEGVPLIRISDISAKGIVDIENTKRLPLNYLEIFQALTIKRNDILMAMTGATIGKSAKYLSEKPGLLNQRVCKFLPTSIHANYLWHVLNSNLYFNHIRITCFGGAQPNISDKQLIDFYLAHPSIEEQQTIARFLDQKTAQLDEQASKINEAINRLNEYRAALITNAVTGKIDVRGFQVA